MSKKVFVYAQASQCAVALNVEQTCLGVITLKANCARKDPLDSELGNFDVRGLEMGVERVQISSFVCAICKAYLRRVINLKRLSIRVFFPFESDGVLCVRINGIGSWTGYEIRGNQRNDLTLSWRDLNSSLRRP